MGHSRDRISYPLATGMTSMTILLTLHTMHLNSASMARAKTLLILSSLESHWQRVIDASAARLGVGPACQAARTVFRNLPTSSLSRLLSPDSNCAAESTCEEADPVSLAPRCTSVM